MMNNSDRVQVGKVEKMDFNNAVRQVLDSCVSEANKKSPVFVSDTLTVGKRYFQDLILRKDISKI